MRRRWADFLLFLAVGLLGAWLSPSKPARAVAVTSEDATAIVNALKDISRNIERQTRAIEDAGRECRK